MSPGATNQPSHRGPLQSRNFRLLVACNVISVTGSAVSFVAIPFAVLRIGGSAWELAALAAAGGVGVGFYYPAAQGLVPQTVPPEQRPRANALDQTGQGAASIAGAAAGGLLIGLAGPGWGLAI